MKSNKQKNQDKTENRAKKPVTAKKFLNMTSFEARCHIRFYKLARLKYIGIA